MRLIAAIISLVGALTGYAPTIVVRGPVMASAPAGGSFSQVQKKTYASTSSASSHTITFDAAPTSGNLCVWVVTSDAIVSTPSGLTLAVSAIDYAGHYIFYRVNGGSESSSTAFVPSASTSLVVAAYEYSGMATSSVMDRTASNTPGGIISSISTGTTATTTQSDELVVATVGISVASGSPTISSWSSSFTTEDSVGSTGSAVNVRVGTAIRKVTSAAAYSSTATLSSTTASPSGAIATFKITSP